MNEREALAIEWDARAKTLEASFNDIAQAYRACARELRAALSQPSPAVTVAHRSTGYVAPKGRYVPPVLFSPYTGEPRDARDIASDPQGVLIVPPGADLVAATPAPQGRIAK